MKRHSAPTRSVLLLWTCAFLLVLAPGQASAEFNNLFGRSLNGLSGGAAARLAAAGLLGNSSRISALLNTFQNNDIQGFSQLVKFNNNQEFIDQGNSLAFNERNRFLAIQPFAIDGFGNFSAGRSLDPETVRQVTEFLAVNRENIIAPNGNFNRRREQVVDGFLARRINPGFFTGRMAFNLASLLDPEDTSVPQNLDTARRYMNFFLNSIIRRNALMDINMRNVGRDGTTVLNLGQFFDRDAMAILASADPTYQCTGRLRANRVMDYVMANPERYYQMINVSDGKTRLTKEQFAAIRGFREKRFDRVNSNILVTDPQGAKQSGVASGKQRLIGFGLQENLPGRACFKSEDKAQLSTAGAGDVSRDHLKGGIEPSPDGEEWLCQQPNCFLAGLLYNAQGQLVDTAPAEIATSKKTLGPTVFAGVSCFDCHNTSKSVFLAGGNKEDGTPYTENFGRIPNTPTVFKDPFTGQIVTHRRFFTNNPTYRRFADTMGQCTERAQDQSESRVKRNDGSYVAPIPETVNTFQKPVTIKRIALEMGVPEQSVLRFFGNNPKFTIPRNDFEANFCQLRQRIAGSGNFLAGGGAGAAGGARTVRGFGH